MAAKLRKGDKVIVLDWQGQRAKGRDHIVDPKAGKAIVDGVNMADPPHQAIPEVQGGRTPKAMPIQLSQPGAVDANGKATRVGFRMEGDNKVRFAKTTGDAI